ncbi:PspC domain-containing protein [Actinopolymorpha alba]|uniref:PspC domain-containing protein n=1 Tax=Actinopolymorpha alba TaxID=533267 RepID=UPI00039C281B|nr:PspC domain-containing protein [Actinopolymorpha alba]
MSERTPRPEQGEPSRSPGALADGILADLRQLRRVRDGRVIAGVCGGLGRRLNVDPVVLRVALAVLALFGGVGILLYAGGWLLLPDEGADRSILEQQLGRRRNGSPDNAVFVGGLVVLGLLVLSLPWWGLPWHVPTLLVLSVLGLVVLLRRNAEHRGPAGGTPGTDPGAAPPGAGPADGPATSPFPFHGGAGATSVVPSGHGDTATMPIPRATEGTGGPHPAADTSRPAEGTPEPATAPLPSHAGLPTPPPGAAPHSGVRPRTTGNVPRPGLVTTTSGGGTDHGPVTESWRTALPAPPEFWNQPDPLGLEAQPDPGDQDWTPLRDPEVSAAPAPRRRRFVLFFATMVTTFLVLSVMAMIDRLGVASSGRATDIPAAGYIAVALAVVGLGLIVGTWFGRSAGLIAVGILLALALIPASVAQRVVNESVDLTVRPVSVAGIEPTYDYPTGRLSVDLSAVPFQDRQNVTTSVDMGAGDVTVIVPPHVDVRFSGDVGVGDLTVFGNSESGPDLSRSTVDYGADGPGGGVLTLKADVGIGRLAVERG